jgi:predicted enzyme related to lactoylglutathione lyase
VADAAPALAAVLYARDLARLVDFYAAIAALAISERDDGHAVLERPGLELSIVAVPARIAAGIAIAAPPRPREEVALKLAFAVDDLAAAAARVAHAGGAMLPEDRTWEFRGQRVRDGHDPEGNVFQLRQPIG